MKSLSTSTNRIHPHSLNVHISRDFSGDLKAELKQIRAATKLPLLVKTYDSKLVKKLTALKFKIISKTYMSTLSNVQTMILDGNQRLRVKSANELTEAQRKAVIGRMRTDYLHVHLENPAEMTPADVANATFNADDFAHDDSIFYFDDFEEVAGYITLFHATHHAVEIGWLCADNPKMLTQLVNTLFIRLKGAGYQAISGEFDTANAQALRVYRALPVSWPADHQPLITLRG
ncbi:hypothetical protein EQG49_00865 [Periweissella cryptocerci]|uniref:Uncharacterized protein n=1 Tax=Periweissella cryptocerci TaxID=2506420 RepID=A0A4V1AID3_9LACO|nr:hypothetical protein [Periweissella cryptocerci]QBO35105.1 hypothetical protein EQG49_00865 [Periweissella cryptocerci]